MKKVTKINEHKKYKEKLNKNETEREKTKRIFKELVNKEIILD